MVYSPSLTDIAAAAAIVWIFSRLMKKQALPYPPGPPGKPIIGNASDIPKTAKQQWEKFTQWKEDYGPIIHISAMGIHFVVLNDVNVAKDLLEKRSAIYSDRPTMPMAGELCGWDRPLVMHHYDDTFKEFRRSFFKLFGTRQNLERFYPLFEVHGQKLMARLIAKPDQVSDMLRKCAGSIILKIAYGYDVAQEGKDPVIDVVDDGMRQLDVLLSAQWLVDLMPFLKGVPEWFPGASFKQTVKAYRKTLDTMADLPFTMIKKKMREGTAEHCFVSSQLSESDVTPEKEYTIKWAATSIYGGGADTTVSAMHTFILSMTLNPDVQRKAQAEVDAVVGRDRFPTLADRPHLPYVEAVFKETLRWQPIAPLAIPHSLMQDDVYNNYLIPKGALVIPNIWAMANDPTNYKNPRKFDPERFVASPGHVPELDPHDLVFGFGRRVCPGTNLADATVWLEIAMSLAVLNFSKARDADGREITPKGEYTEANVTHPVNFPLSIKPRDAQAEALIQAGAGTD
ncbi:cytochrome P450 [Vararia minispora EC-137]|uniref:Cytochrome P450 n=1 Tax=Vararia minispora EC-137 TaxID=1314806 RepID=A0ACB8QBH7_9AGAM|nr:cytochrome P450 [Vararia minispora EC-137]